LVNYFRQCTNCHDYRKFVQHVHCSEDHV
jgi:hypothetical protein